MAKKKTSVFNKLLLAVNSLFAALLFLSYFLPFVSPKNIPILAVLSLLAPFLIIINLIFFVYWLIKLKRHFLTSGIILAIGWLFASPFYKFSGKKVLLNNDLKVMSYNVRLFNLYKWNKDEKTTQNIIDLILKSDPDILAIQEYYKAEKLEKSYPFKHIKLISRSCKNCKPIFGSAIFSKFPIINSGSFNFKGTSNNIIYVDVVKDNDTIRIYNSHLQSLKINPKKENFGQESSEKLIERISWAFKKQAEQTEEFLAHEKKWNGKKIICGDFNNTAYSWVYNKFSTNSKDAFVEAGKGFGKTFNYPFPARIDFIFTDKDCNINYFKTYKEKFSDHFPILTRVNWDN